MLKEAVRAAEQEQMATVFGYWVSDPERYGVVEFAKEGPDGSGGCIGKDSIESCCGKDGEQGTKSCSGRGAGYFRCISIEEKPKVPKSNYAVVGLYFYPNSVVQVAREIKPSARGEYEITSVNNCFLERGRLLVQRLGRGFAWLDTGTHDSLSEASTYIEVLEKRQGLKIACLEAIAYRKGWIDEQRMRALAEPMLHNQYGKYLLKVIEELKQNNGDPNLE